MLKALSVLLLVAKDLTVPTPIPPDFNRCVRVIVTEKGRANGVKSRVAQLDPPLTREDHAYLEYWRREGWAKLELCDERKT